MSTANQTVTVAGADSLAWIREHGRFRRSLDVGTLERALGRPNKHCVWCGRLCEGRRYRWCSPGCSDAFFTRTSGNIARNHVFRRDRGVCSICGIDTERLWKALASIRQGVRVSRDQETIEWRRRRAAAFKFFQAWPKSEGFATSAFYSFWQADHVIPVCEGGGLCGIDGLRTLCTRCHKGESRKLAARRAAARRLVKA